MLILVVNVKCVMSIKVIRYLEIITKCETCIIDENNDLVVLNLKLVYLPLLAKMTKRITIT